MAGFAVSRSTHRFHRSFRIEILQCESHTLLDDAPLEERRARAVQMRRMLPESVLEEVGGLDQAAIAQVRDEAWPDVRDADELHDVLHTLVALPEVRVDFGSGQWKFYFDRLVAEGRAASAVSGGRLYWVAAERAKTFSVLFPEARFEPKLTEVEGTVPSREDALLTLVTGWMSHLGPTRASELGETLGASGERRFFCAPSHGGEWDRSARETSVARPPSSRSAETAGGGCPHTSSCGTAGNGCAHPGT